jgi:DHA1 family tetracycline resistance protein-like MFS transporter
MNRKPSLLVIFLSVFIDLIGFGIVLPLLPGFAEDNFRPDFSAKGFVIGGIIASFSLMQFLFAPAWGKLSDRIGCSSAISALPVLTRYLRSRAA